MKRIKGSSITAMHTGGMYNNNCLIVYVNRGRGVYYLDAAELFKFNKPFKELIFRVEVKRVRKYLKVEE